MQINDWQYVAELDHTEKGNILRKVTEIEVPERYYHTDTICEHCNSKRRRNFTYIVMNVKTGEFKQVGKSCLKDFTHGMNAEAVADYQTALHEIEEAGRVGGGYTDFYYDKQNFLQYVIECINKFGYVKSSESDSTVSRARGYIRATVGRAWDKYDEKYLRELREEMEKVGFRHDREENKETAKKAVEWATKQEEDTNYMHNLITVCGADKVSFRNSGILASLIPVYYRAIEREMKIAEKKAQEAQSEWQGNVGDKVTVQISDWRIVTGWNTQWGYTYIYKMIDEKGNIYTWKTSNYIEDGKKIAVTGKIKDHTEFRGVKQTELTRCKVQYIKEEQHEEAGNDVSEAMNMLYE